MFWRLCIILFPSISSHQWECPQNLQKNASAVSGKCWIIFLLSQFSIHPICTHEAVLLFGETTQTKNSLYKWNKQQLRGLPYCRKRKGTSLMRLDVNFGSIDEICFWGVSYKNAFHTVTHNLHLNFSTFYALVCPFWCFCRPSKQYYSPSIYWVSSDQWKCSDIFRMESKKIVFQSSANLARH